LRAVLEGSTWSGVHPASLGDQLSYWVTYRPTSPVVLGPAALLLLVLGGGGFAGMRLMGGRKNKYELLDEDG
jgi:hypothetical protein